MKKTYIAPEIKTMIVDNVVMAATSGESTTSFSLGSKDDYATAASHHIGMTRIKLGLKLYENKI